MTFETLVNSYLDQYINRPSISGFLSRDELTMAMQKARRMGRKEVVAELRVIAEGDHLNGFGTLMDIERKIIRVVTS